MKLLAALLGRANEAQDTVAAEMVAMEPRLTGETFLASLMAARASVIADGLHVLLAAHDCTIGDDPQFGLPSKFAA